MCFCFCKSYPLCILKCIPAFSALLHTKVGAPPVDLRAVICRKSTLCRYAEGGGWGEGVTKRPKRECGVKSPVTSSVCPRSQRIAAIVNRGKHRVTSGGPRLRYKILPRVTRCSPPRRNARVLPSRSAVFHSTCPRDDSADNGGAFAEAGVRETSEERDRKKSPLSSCAPFNEQAVCAAIEPIFHINMNVVART